MKPKGGKHLALPDASPFVGSYSFRLLSYYIKQHHKTLLALGCGSGEKLEYWESKGLTVAGADIDPEKGEICKAKQIPFTLVDLDKTDEPLPYDDGSFDVVTMLHTLEHLKHPKRVVHEATRIAKDLVLINSPLGHSYFSDDHVQFWYSFEDIMLSLFSVGYVFFLEVVIAKPADVRKGTVENVFDLLYNHVGFTAAIYKQQAFDPMLLDATDYEWFLKNLARAQAAMGNIRWCEETGKIIISIWGNNEKIELMKEGGYQRDLSWMEKLE